MCSLFTVGITEISKNPTIPQIFASKKSYTSEQTSIQMGRPSNFQNTQDLIVCLVG